MENLENYKMQYFGTDLHTHGHYFWIITDEWLERSGVDFNSLSFNPYNIVKKDSSKGTTVWRQTDEFSILGIVGSCKDERGGTVSVFFTEEKLNQEEMIAKLKDMPVVMDMFKAMKFKLPFLDKKKYQPSNGSEQDMFLDNFCWRCIHCNPDPSGKKQCEILGMAMAYSVTDEEYPEEWTYDEDDDPTCTKWKKWDWEKDGDPDAPDNPKVPAPIDPNQLNLF